MRPTVAIVVAKLELMAACPSVRDTKFMVVVNGDAVAFMPVWLLESGAGLKHGVNGTLAMRTEGKSKKRYQGKGRAVGCLEGLIIVVCMRSLSMAAMSQVL